MSARIKIKDIDHGYNALRARVREMKGSHTKVGFPKENPVAVVAGAEATNMSEVAQVAFWNEYGTTTIPERSFLRSTIDENRESFKTLMTREVGNIIDGDRSVKSALGLIGEFGTLKVQRKIVNVRTPENAPATIKKKGFDNPLIATGQMRQSVSHHEVVK